MALPKINETLNFTATIPSTGKKIKYRPYLVKEEKILLQAFESQNIGSIIEAMCDTISACIDPRSNVDVDNLATFDVEYLFTQLRAASVGETSTVLVKCSECETDNEISVDLSELEVHVENTDNVVQLTDEISVEMKYPSYSSLNGDELQNLNENDAESVIALLSSSLEAVLTEEERIDVKSQKPDEVKEFLNSLTTAQFQKIATFLQNLPALEKGISFTCENCGKENETKLRGLADFF